MTRSSDPSVALRTDPGVDHAGSLLLEAAAGVAMIGLFMAAAAAVLPVALEAQARATSHRAALIYGDSLHEVAAVGLPRSIVPPPTSFGLTGAHAGYEDAAVAVVSAGSSCGPAVPRAESAILVRTFHGGRSEGRSVVLASGPRVGSVRDEGPTAIERRITLRAVTGGMTAGLVLVDTDGVPREPGRWGSGCVEFDDVPAGTSWLSDLSEGPVLVDSLHVPIVDRPVPITTTEGAHARTVDVWEAAWLHVDIDDRGARRPDHVEGGALSWLVRGDDANLASDLGATRRVSPGRVTAVVAPCPDSTATGSTASIDLGPGEHASLEIDMAVVAVQNLRGNVDAWLQVQRARGCADGVPQLPALRFEGALHEGMRIALPRGEWDVWLRNPGGNRITLSVPLLASGSDAVVRLP